MRNNYKAKHENISQKYAPMEARKHISQYED